MKNNLFKTKYFKLNKAFTLVELLISLTIFSFVVVMAVGALYSAQNFSAKAQEAQVVLDGLNFTVEIMSREIRYGTDFYCDTVGNVPVSDAIGNNDCALGVGKVIYFRPQGLANRVAYYLQGETIKKIDFNTGITEDVTSPDIKIEAFNFYVNGAKGIYSSDYNQPKVTLIIAGQTKPTSIKTNPTVFRIQNTITQRGLDSV